MSNDTTEPAEIIDFTTERMKKLEDKFKSEVRHLKYNYRHLQ